METARGSASEHTHGRIEEGGCARASAGRARACVCGCVCAYGAALEQGTEAWPWFLLCVAHLGLWIFSRGLSLFICKRNICPGDCVVPLGVRIHEHAVGKWRLSLVGRHEETSTQGLPEPSAPHCPTGTRPGAAALQAAVRSQDAAPVKAHVN